MEIDRKKIVVVLGMHRSGTSAVMRGLEVLGVNLGDNLYPPAIDNPKGFWEDRDILAINLELLSLLDSGTECLGLFESTMEDTLGIRSLRVKAEKLLREKCGQYPAWGFKDPRTARLLPFWQSVFEGIEREVLYVIANRNPVSIVESLRTRNAIEPEKSFYLWLEHLIPAVLKTKGNRRVVIDYDRLMEYPESELSRIAKALDLPAPDPSALAAYCNEFLDAELCHSIHTGHELEGYPAVPSQVVVAYHWLVKLACDTVSFDSQQIEDDFLAISSEVRGLSALLRFIERQDQRISAYAKAATESAALSSQAESLMAHNAWLSSERDAWEKVSAEHESMIADMQVYIQELTTGNALLASQRDAWAKVAAEREGRIKALLARVRALFGRKS